MNLPLCCYLKRLVTEVDAPQNFREVRARPNTKANILAVLTTGKLDAVNQESDASLRIQWNANEHASLNLALDYRSSHDK